nr:esterase [uncultured bacterium]
MRRPSLLGLALLMLPGVAVADETPVSIQSAGVPIVGILNKPDGVENPPVVLMLHGFTGQKNEFPTADGAELFAHAADGLAEAGIATLRIDFRGSGESGGEWADTTFSTQTADAVAAFDSLENMDGVDGSRVGILGYSQGGLVGAHLAALRPQAGAVVLWAPVTNPIRTYGGLLGVENVETGLTAPAEQEITAPLSWGGETTLRATFFHELASTDPVGAIASYPGPLAVIVGLKETIVTPQPAAGQLLLNYHEGAEKLVTVESDHDWGWSASRDIVDADLLPPTVAWFSEHLAQ